MACRGSTGLERRKRGGWVRRAERPRRGVPAHRRLPPRCLTAGHCPNPGVSVGAVRTGSRFGLGDKVSYRCSSNLVLTGSAERECQSNGAWSGTEPICRRE